MLLLPQIRQPSPPRALGPPPDDVDTHDGGRVNLEPHLDARLHEVAPELDGRVDPSAADLHQRAGEGLPAVGRHHEHVADLGAVRAGFGEEGSSGAGGVEGRDGGGVEGGHGVFGGRWGGMGGGGIDGGGGGFVGFRLVCSYQC